MRRFLLAGLFAATLTALVAGPWAATARATPFDGNAMWLWELHKSGGNAAAIIHRAKANHIRDVFIKSADGTSLYRDPYPNGPVQFTSSLVHKLKAAGLRVCGWQYVYGSKPKGEAAAGAAAKRRGAQCLIIDAEAQYEHKYAPADKYISALRRKVGAKFPIALAGFPYVDYHPSFPYSVFMRPGGAQFNIPQMYWHTIGVSVPTIYSHTYVFNRPYGRQIFPLGQTYGGTPTSQMYQFRHYAREYGAGGVNWWSWQETAGSEWSAVGGKRISGGVPGRRRNRNFAGLGPGSSGDLVVWAQEHLKRVFGWVHVDGSFGSQTSKAVRKFQRRAGLPVTGKIGNGTWKALLKRRAVVIHWGGGSASGASAAGASSASRSFGPSAPKSASLPAVAYEIPPPDQR